MPVYVDNFYVTGVTYRGMKMSHMIADSTEELLKMVAAIGVNPKWIQHPGTCNEHFDICYSKRVEAIQAGAIEIEYRHYAKFIWERCDKYGIRRARASIDKIKT